MYIAATGNTWYFNSTLRALQKPGKPKGPASDF